MLIKDYYEIISEQKNGDNGCLWEVHILPDADVYRGHFPGNPVSPGVCNIQLISECAAQAIGQEVWLASVGKCKFRSLITPSSETLYRVKANCSPSGTETWKVVAQITEGDLICVEFTGNFRAYGAV